jgi:VCBS repeat-containing protein
MPKRGASKEKTVMAVTGLSFSPVRWRWLRAVAALLLLFPQLFGVAQPALAVSTSVVISQVYGGGGNTGATYKNDFIELYNRSSSPVSLVGWSVQYASATGTSWTPTNLSGSIAPGSYYLIQEAAGTGGTTNLPTPDASGSIAMSGTAGKVALVNSTTLLSGSGCPIGPTVVDFVGFGTTANCFEGSSPAPAPSNTNADIRANSGATDTDSNSADFTAALANPRNSSSGGPAAPSITTQPQSQTIPYGGTATLTVAASGTAPLSYQWYEGASGTTSTPVGTNSSNFTTPALTATTQYWVRVSNSSGTADSTTATITVNATPCAAPDVTIGSVQGTGDTAASGTFTVQGVVVGDYEGASPALRGFYLQDSGDSNAATSDGIFVFEGDNANRVSVGDVVQVTGTASENQGQSQLSSTTGVELCGTTSTVTPTDVSLPFASATAAEQYEGMLVRFPQTLYVTEHFQLGRFGQVLMSSGGRLKQPTNVTTPGASALAQQAANDLNQIIVDDDTQAQNPDPILFGRGGQPLSASNTLRGADTAAGVVGVMTYTWSGNAASGNAYRLRPVGALGGGVPSFQTANPRPSSVPNVGGALRVTAANLLNYFNTFGTGACKGGTTGAAMDCRGADNATEFARQWPKTVAALTGNGADVIAVMELENDGYGSSSAIQDLVGKLNSAAGAGTYAFIDADAATGQTDALGSDAIKVAIIYKPAKVTPVGTTAVLNSTAFVNGGDGAARNRPALAQAFEQNSNGARFIVVANHLKSKGSACDAPDAGDGQGNCNTVRTNAANTLMTWLGTNPTSTGDPDVLIVGDLNSYAQEDPITAIKSAGYTNLIEANIGQDAYSYVFDGQWGYLDHALGSAGIVSQLAGVGEWHINADEPSVLDYNTDFKTAGQITSLYNADEFRVSDHDPVIIGLNLNAPAATAPTITTQPQSQTITSGQTATLSVVASGTAPLSYQWYEGASGDTASPISGATSASFTTPALTATTSYWVRVSNSAGNTDSTTATVTVQAPCSAPDVTIGSVQGTGDITPLNGQTVTVQGVVVLDYEGASPALRGFYVQDGGDGDAATSDGIFVFEGDNANRVSVGQVVQVTGAVSENQGQSQLSSTTGIELCGTTGTVTPADVAMPFASATALEAYEGMLVRFPQTLYVTEHFQLGRFGQIVMSSGGRLKQPTNVVEPGAAANALQAQNDLNRLIVDDDTQAQNPDPIKFGRGGQPLSASNTLRGGDTVAGMVGVMTYTWAGNSASPNAYRLRPIGALGGGVPNFQPANPRPASAPSVGGTLKVAGMNLLNFFNTFDGLPDTVDNCTNGVGGAATDCRGADTQAEFDRQWPKTVAAIQALDPDVLGVNEIENDGYGTDSAIQFLVNKLNDATAPGTYAFINVDANTGQVNALGTDAIKVGMIYKPAKVTPVGQTAALNSTAFVNGGDSAPRSRPSLAQAFEQNSNGERFIVDLNHLKSKGSACTTPDAGDGQGNCNIVRTNAATALVNWLATDPTGTGDPDILLIGDYNSYAQEDPIDVIKAAGFTNLIETRLGADAYSYVFDGQWGYLDHALASDSMNGQVAGVGDYHINSDEPSVLDYNTDFKTANLQSTLYAPDQFRVSDHDSVLIGLNLINNAPTADAQSVTTNEDTAKSITLSGSDPEGHALTYSYSQPTHGSVAGTGPNVTYTPAANYNGADSFTFTVNDGTSDSAPATVSITVTPVNDAPTAVNDSYTATEDTTLTVAAPGVLLNDSDVDGDTLTASIATLPAFGTATVSANGALSYTPNANFCGPDSLTYAISDGNGGTASATVTITVACANDAPVANTDTLTVLEDAAATTVNVRANDTDPEGNTLTVTSVTQGSKGVVTLNAGVVSYKPNANANGSDSFTYTISDGNGGTATGTVNVTITPVNDNPSAVNDTATAKKNGSVVIAVLANDSDVDIGDTITLVSVTQGTKGGTVTKNANGTVTFKPKNGFTGTDTFTYTISDGHGGTATATVTVTVTK